MRLEVTVTRLLNGAYEVSAIVCNQLVRNTYYGYTKKEAVAEFRRHVKRYGA